MRWAVDVYVCKCMFALLLYMYKRFNVIHYVQSFIVACKTASFIKSHDSHMDQWSYLPPSHVVCVRHKIEEIALIWESLNSICPSDSSCELLIPAALQAVVS